MSYASKLPPEVTAAALGVGAAEADQIPKYAHVQVPLASRFALRHSADILRRLAMSLDMLSRRPDIHEVPARIQAWTEIKAANLRMAKSAEALEAEREG